MKSELNHNKGNSAKTPAKKPDKKFFCSICGEEKTGPKYKLYDENYNPQNGYECQSCFEQRLN